MQVNTRSTVSASPKGYMNGRLKLFKKYTCSFIERQKNMAQLFSIGPTSNITFPGLLSKKNYTTIFRPASTVERQERETLSAQHAQQRDFYEWLSGFVDAEGFFYIVISRSCAFRFQINLHKDDINVLYYIHKTLGFGEVRSYHNFSSFTVTRLKDIALLLKIFDQYPLQGSKWLNYRDFSKAFYLYLNSDRGAGTLKDILNIKNGMNRLRSDFTMPNDKEIHITPYWLLGFIEGEGCFSINKRNNYRLDFSLCQSSTNLELLQKIKIYLENLSSVASTDGSAPSSDVGALGISMVRTNNPNHKPTVRIETARVSYITEIFIPFLESLTWRSKKKLDFEDWKNICVLKEQGHHLSNQGVKLIDLILSQMNNNRLSTTASSLPAVDRTRLLAEINLMLNEPSNFGLRNGRKWIISLNKYYNSSRTNICVTITDENGNNLHSFDSLADCAKFLDVDPSTVSKRIQKGIPFLFENKLAYIKRGS